MATGSLTEFTRFGYGPAPGDRVEGTGVDPDRLLAQLSLPAPEREDGLADRLALLADQEREKQAMKAGGPKTDVAIKQLRQRAAADVQAYLWDPVLSDAGFAERLVNFWANRLTVAWRRGPVEFLMGPYRDEAIRPHIGGRFADMLAASAWHPAMMVYLDQAASVGPNSPFGQKQRKGLNENYAREFLELHTMGGVGYSQTDVTELARLFAGMRYDEEGARFDSARSEPGEKTILGQTYLNGPDEIARLVETVALRPETAESVALALARHFIADVPPADLVAGLAAAYLAGGSDLRPVYQVLLSHPSAADPGRWKVRSPHEYLAASLRALGVTPDIAGGRKVKLALSEALKTMGQQPLRAPGPDGWPEVAEGWVTAPYLAARLAWAETLAQKLGEGALPADLARFVLGDGAEGPEADTIRAASRAEQRWEGVAVLLGAPVFQRR